MKLLARLALGCAVALAAACGEYMHVIYGYMDTQGRWVVPPAYDDALPFSEGLAAVKQGERWGFIDARGRWVVQPSYESVASFSEGRAGVYADGHWSYIDATGAEVIAGPFMEANPFSGGVAAVEIGEKWGFVDHSGRQVVVPRFDALGDSYARDFGETYLPCFSEGLCAARDGKSWGYIDRSGEWVIAPKYAEAGRFAEGLARVRESNGPDTDKVGFVGRSGAMVIPARFRDALWFSGGRAIVIAERGSSQPTEGAGGEQPALTAWMIDPRGQPIAEVGWDEIAKSFDSVAEYLETATPDYLAEGMIPASRGKLWGYMDRHGRWMIEPRYGLVFPFQGGRAVVMTASATGEMLGDDTRVGIIDATGQWVVPPGLEAVGSQSPSEFSARLHGRWGVLDADGHWRIEPRYRDIDAVLLPYRSLGTPNGLRRVAVTANHEWIVADRRGRILGKRECEWLESAEPGGQPHPNRLGCAQGESWGLTDLRLRTAAEPQFDDPPRRLDRFLLVSRQGLQGCADEQGRVVVPIEFEDVRTCSRDGAIVRRGQTWGTWDKERGWRASDAQKPESFAACEDDETTCVNVGSDATWVRDGAQFVLVIAGRVVASVAPADEVEVVYARGTSPDGRAWIAHVRRGNRWGVVDDAGREWLPARYDEIGSAYDGMVAARRGDRWQIVDARQRVLFAESDVKLSPFNREVAIFRDGESYGLVSRNGRLIVPARYHFLEPLTRHDAVFVAESNADDDQAPQRKGILDDTGRVRVPAEFSDIHVYSDFLWTAQGTDGNWNLVDRATGRRLAISDRMAGPPGPVREGLSATNLKRADGTTATGYLDVNGRVAIEANFDAGIQGGFTDGLAIVARNGNCGTIDRRGRALLPLKYVHCSYVGDGLVIAATHVPWRMPAKPGATTR